MQPLQANAKRNTTRLRISNLMESNMKANKRNFDKCFNSKRIPRKLKKELRKSPAWVTYCLVKLATHSYSNSVLDLLATEA